MIWRAMVQARKSKVDRKRGGWSKNKIRSENKGGLQGLGSKKDTSYLKYWIQ